MSLNTDLEILKTNIESVKNTLYTNLTNKGVTDIAESDTLSTLANKVDSITVGGGNGECASAIDFSSIGYDAVFSNEMNSQINDDVAYSKSLYDAWNPSNTSASNLYKNDKKLVYAPNIETSNVTKMDSLFDDCTRLTTVPLFNTSNVTRMSYMFRNCSSLTSIPLFDTSNVTDMYNMFYGCTKLTTVPLFNTSNVTSMSYMFTNCNSLTSIQQFDTSNVTNMGYMLQYCSSLTSIPLLDTSKVTNIIIFGYTTTKYNNLTELGGFKDLKIDWNANYGLYQCPNLTYESVMNVINNLYDFRANGDDTTTRTLKLNANSLALLSDDDKAIATSKGWTLA